MPGAQTTKISAVSPEIAVARMNQGHGATLVFLDYSAGCHRNRPNVNDAVEQVRTICALLLWISRWAFSYHGTVPHGRFVNRFRS
jgi:hypothetical protein